MGFFKRFAGFLGFAKEDEDDTNNNSNKNSNLDENRGKCNRMKVDPVHVGQRKGFSVPVQVPVDRPSVGPILVPCNGDGGLQGFNWYVQRLRVDEDGDVADEFLHEVPPDSSHPSNLTMHDPSKPLPRFQVKNYERRPKLTSHKLTPDGKLQHLVVYQGRRQWV